MSPAGRLVEPGVTSAALLDHVDFFRLDASRKLKPDQRGEMGQFLTPSRTASQMASMFSEAPQEVRLLDAGAGVGSLLAAFVVRTCTAKTRPVRLAVTAFEIDPVLCEYLAQTLDACREFAQRQGVKFESALRREDFLRASVEVTRSDLFSSKGGGTFNRAILNPPYGKLNVGSEPYRLLKSAGAETTNLYTAFLALVERAIDSGGELVAITPRSFCNGPYFRSFRKSFLRRMTFREIHVFTARNAIFEDDSVLQENIIFRTVKGADTDAVTLSSHEDADGHEVQVKSVPYAQLIRPSDQDSFIRLTTNDLDSSVTAKMDRFTHTIEDLGLSVSTGRVVDFRCRPSLCSPTTSKSAPLIYPRHFDEGFIRWPVESKRPEALAIARETDDLLIKADTYVLVKRFTSKEERRRVVAAIYDPKRIPSDRVGFENHLNYFHSSGEGLRGDLSRGLATFLNSTLVDTYFRQFSGHTQVNATDLRSLKYPSPSQLENLGRCVGDSFADQDTVDRLVSEELLEMADSPGAIDPIKAKRLINEALEILKAIGMPREQQNERSALTLLALLDMDSHSAWADAQSPMRGITEMMKFFERHFGKVYAPNTRETVRRFTVHQFVQAGLVVANPDKPERPTNSPKAVYQIESGALALLRLYGNSEWDERLRAYLASIMTLARKYAQEREMNRIPVRLSRGEKLELSPGGQNELISHILTDFCERFTPGGMVLYVGDTAKKWVHFDKEGLEALGVKVGEHGKMPDVVIYHSQKGWLVLIEAVTSHGPVNPKRRTELKTLFKGSTVGLVFVTAFLSRSAMLKYLGDIAWETEVWVADAPTHLIHFNGERFLGPYDGVEV